MRFFTKGFGKQFYHWTNSFRECLEGMADGEPDTEMKTVTDLLDEIEEKK